MIEAKRRGLACADEYEKIIKKRIAEEKALKEKEIQEKLEKDKIIKAEQEKIKKKAEEKALKKKIADEKARKIAEKKALKKKIADEKARKIAEKKAKKEAEIKAKKLAEEKLKIKNAKEESAGFYTDIISYVKTDDIDVVQLSEFFENKPKPTKNWTTKDLKAYEELKRFINKSVTFMEFHTNEKEKRAKAKLNLKLATIDKLENNLNNFEIILKENFGNIKITKIVRQHIEKTKKIVSDEKYKQNLADKILLQNDTYLVTYKMNKNKLIEIDKYLNAAKNKLSQILKDNFGTTKGNKASKYLKNIDNAESLSEKTELKSVIERFLNPPQKIVSAQKQENKNTASYFNSKKQIMTKSQKNVLEVRKNDTYEIPSEQKEFLNIVIKAQSSAIGASNDMQRGGYLSTRSKELCGLLRPINFRVNNWVGTIYDIDSNSDGKGYYL